MTSTRFFAFRGPETSYGDGATGSTWYKIRATGIGDPVNRNVSFEEALDIAAPTYAVAGSYVVNGTLDAILRFEGFAPLFESMLGATAGDTYYLTDTPTSYAFLIGDDQANVQTSYYGCGITSMEFTFAVKEFVRVRMSWLGQKAQIIDSGSHVSPAFYVAPTADNAAVYYNAIISVNGNPLQVKNLTLRIDRKFDTDYFYIGSPLLQGLYMNGQTEVSGTMTLGGGQWESLKNVMTGGQTTSITANMQTTSAGTENKNELVAVPMEITLHDKDGVELGTIRAGSVVFSESNRSVQGRNQWDKTVNYRVIVPTATDFYITAA